MTIPAQRFSTAVASALPASPPGSGYGKEPDLFPRDPEDPDGVQERVAEPSRDEVVGGPVPLLPLT